jgi:drug/metabolite transporter (DMT)-like permease
MSVPAAYFAVVLIWSTTPLAVKWSGEGPGFLLGATARMAIATILCLALVAILRIGLPWHRDARRAYMSGALGAFAAMMLIYWAAQYLPSGVISVLFGLSPLVTALLAWPLLNEPGFTTARVGGMLLGLAGLVLIFGAGLARGPHVAAGLAALCAAVVLQSLSMVLIKRHAGAVHSLSVTSGALLIATPLFVLSWALFDHRVPAEFPARAFASILYLGVVGSVVGFTLFFYVLKHVTASGSALITLITPVFALLIGAYINHEDVGMKVWAGAGFVLAGLATHQWGDRLLRLLPR